MYIGNASLRGLRSDVLDELAQPWTGENGQPAFYRKIVDYDERYLQENESRLPSLSIPVRILWGAQDAWIPAERAEQMRALIPKATAHIVPGSGHLIQFDAPSALMDQLRDWLEGQVR